MFEEKSTAQAEQGLDIPYEQLDPETLIRMIQEFVSRDGADWGDAGCTLEDKVVQVMDQLRNKQVKIVFDLQTQTANFIVSPSN